MTSTRRTQVVVSGGGPVGAVAAAYLAQHGIDVVLAEAGADCAQDLRASTFHPPTLEMLDELNVTSALIEKGLKAPIYHWRDRRTAEILPFDLSEIADVTRYPFRVQCEQYHLARMLTERLETLDRAEVLFNHRVVHFTQDDAGVEVHLESPFGIETVKADYLIGADGASSIVRKWLDTEFDGFTYPERFLTLSTTWPIEQGMPGLAHVNYVSDPQEWLVLLRVPSVWRVLVPAHEESEEFLRSDAKKNAVFDGIMGDGAAVETQHRTIYRVHQRVAKQFRHGRVLLVGDAAHLNNPLGGFGMNSGIHDAFNACGKLVEIIKGGASSDLLDLYDRQRRKVTFDFTQRQTMENMEAMRAGQGETHAKREAAMRNLLADDKARRAYLLRQAMFDSLDQAAAIN
jgi:3-(3-hydroxy-phenyl)propionate hydroxylase